MASNSIEVKSENVAMTGISPVSAPWFGSSVLDEIPRVRPIVQSTPRSFDQALSTPAKLSPNAPTISGMPIQLLPRSHIRGGNFDALVSVVNLDDGLISVLAQDRLR